MTRSRNVSKEGCVSGRRLRSRKIIFGREKKIVVSVKRERKKIYKENQGGRRKESCVTEKGSDQCIA